MLAYRTLLAVVLAVVAGGCATTGNTRRGEPMCRAEIGMSEAQFLDCACYRPYLNPEGGVALVTTVETRLGTSRAYRCSLVGPLGEGALGDPNVISVSTTNGKITRVGR